MTSAPHPRKDPSRRCRPLAEWPAADRAAWQAATEVGDILDPGGDAAHWSPTTRDCAIQAYGRLLTWLTAEAVLDPAAGAADRLTPDIYRRYLAMLRATVAPHTVLFYIRMLRMALRVMAPAADLAWMVPAERRLDSIAIPVRDKRARMVPVSVLFELGRSLMAAAEADTGGPPLERAGLYRDGLIIAMLAARPLRIANAAALVIGEHLFRDGAGYSLRIAAPDTKGRRPIEERLPDALIAPIDRYLAHHRPILARHPQHPAKTDTGHLWLSCRHGPLSVEAFYGAVVKRTTAGLGHALSPHAFRDSAATSIAIDDSANVAITRSVLNHASLRTSERHYNHAGSLDAVRRHQAHILALRRDPDDGQPGGRG